MRRSERLASEFTGTVSVSLISLVVVASGAACSPNVNHGGVLDEVTSGETSGSQDLHETESGADTRENGAEDIGVSDHSVDVLPDCIDACGLAGEVDTVIDVGVETVCPDGLSFWEDHEVCAPAVTPCSEPWELPLVGGGCMVVGPRACPKTWEPDADVDCQPGDLLPCPEGFVETDDGVACIPYFADCGDLEIPVLGGGCTPVGAPELDVPDPIISDCPPGERPTSAGDCIPVLADPCPAGPFPVVLEESTDLQYVSASSNCIFECGTEDQPWPTIESAVSQVADHGQVLVGPGTYDEGVLLERPIHLTGLCPSEVHVIGSTVVPVITASYFSYGTVVVAGTANVEIRGISVVPPDEVWTSGIVVAHSDDVSISQVAVANGGSAGIYLYDSEASLTEIWVHGEQLGNEASSESTGIQVREGSSLLLEQSLIEHRSPRGLYVRDVESHVSVEDTAIRWCGLELKSVTPAGIVVVDSATIEGNDLVVTETMHSGISITENAEAVLTNTVLNGVKDLFGVYSGVGLSVAHSAKVSCEDIVITNSEGTGLLIRDLGTIVSAFNLTIGWTESGADASAIGIELFNGATLVAEALQVHHYRGPGIQIIGVGSVLDAKSCQISGSTDVGSDPWEGILALDGASVQLEFCTVKDSSYRGLRLEGIGSEATLESCAILDTMPGPWLDGWLANMLVWYSATATVSKSLISGSNGVGIVVSTPESSLDMHGTLIRGPSVPPDWDWASGLFVEAGAQVDATQCLFESNPNHSIQLNGSETRLNLSESTVRDTILIPGKSLSGSSCNTHGGATFFMHRCHLDDEQAERVLIYGKNSEAFLSESHLSTSSLDFLAGDSFVPSGGAIVYHGDLYIDRSYITDMITGLSVGSLPEQSSAVLSVRGSVIRASALPEDLRAGIGIGATAGLASIEDCLIHEPVTTGVLARNPETFMWMNRSAILDCRSGGAYTTIDGEKVWQTFGDGVFAGEGTVVDVSSSVLMNNARCGFYYFNSSGSLEDNVVVGNASYGLAMQLDDQVVEFEDQGNWLFGNAWELPQSLAMQVTTEPGNLPVPEPPLLAGED